MSQSIVRNTIGEQVFSELRGRIVSCRLRPGEKLRPDDIATELQVSQTPVKEALLRLGAEGLVETVPRRGTVVRRFTKTHAIELFEVRAMIETWALRAGFADNRVTPGFLEQIGQTIKDLGRTTANGEYTDMDAAMEIDRRMHLLIVGLSGNEMMMDWYRRVISQTAFIRLYAVMPERVVETETEHRAIYNALQTGDVEAVLGAMQAHFDSACGGLLINDEEDNSRRSNTQK